MKKNYQAMLNDPRWQKKRLHIMERDNWTCRCCESQENSLHVHHLYYIYGNAPWDYPDEKLITVCDKCHEWITSIGNPWQFIVNDYYENGGDIDPISLLAAIRGDFGAREQVIVGFLHPQMSTNSLKFISMQIKDTLKSKKKHKVGP